MQAYHGNTELKAQFVALIAAHEAADTIIQGTYWRAGRGCAVGCSIDSLNKILRARAAHDDHAAYESLIGVPRILARLEDGIFEGLPLGVAKTWPRRFAEAIRPGADLSGVWPRFAHWLLVDAEHGVLRFAKNERQRTAIQSVADLYARQISGEEIGKDIWNSAYAAAAAATTTAAVYAATTATTAATAYAAAAAAYAAYAYAATTAATTTAATTAATATAAAAAAAATAVYAAVDAVDAVVDAVDAKQRARIAQADRLIALLEAS